MVSKLISLTRKLLTNYMLKGNFQHGLRLLNNRSISTTSCARKFSFVEHFTYSIHENTDEKIPQFVDDISDEAFHSAAKYKQFMTYFPGILKDIETKAASMDPLEHGKHITNLIEYQIADGKKYSGIIAAETYKILAPEEKKTEQDIRMAYNLGWCIELLIDSLNMTDDIMDNGEIRRNKPCWHRLPENQKSAINDAFLIEINSYYLLQKYFGHMKYFPALQEMFNQTSYSTSFGQAMEMKVMQHLDAMTLQTYEVISKNISVWIVGCFPIFTAMTLAGYTDTEMFMRARPVLQELGYFYHLQNDFLDCFGDEAYGKVGSDIQEGKCRWLAITCMERASEAQKKIMKANYGNYDPNCVKKIKDLYVELKLPEFYSTYTNELYGRLMESIEKEPNPDMKKVFMKLAEPITDSTNVGGLFP